MLCGSLESFALTDKVNLMQKTQNKKPSRGICEQKESESMCGILGQSLDFTLFFYCGSYFSLLLWH